MLSSRQEKDINADDVVLGSDAAAIRRSFVEKLFFEVAKFPGVAAFAVLLVALAGQASSSTVGRAGEGRPGRAFSSPDGRRVVRLILQSADEQTLERLGLDRATRDQLRNFGPSLRIEFSRVQGDREIIVRSFTGPGGAGGKARYRVLWDDQSRRFVVLAARLPGRRPLEPRFHLSGEPERASSSSSIGRPSGFLRWRSSRLPTGRVSL